MKNILALFLLLLPWMPQAQNDEAHVEAMVTEFTTELKNKGTDQFFVYKSYCVGQVRMLKLKDKMCASKSTFVEAYVVWNEAGLDKIKKFDNCGEFYIADLSDTQVMDFYNAQWRALMDDEVKPYHSASYTGEPELRKTPQPCYREFYLQSPQKEVRKKFNLFALSNDSDGKNLNYAFNQTLKLVALHELMEKTLSKTTFIRE